MNSFEDFVGAGFSDSGLCLQCCMTSGYYASGASSLAPTPWNRRGVRACRVAWSHTNLSFSGEWLEANAVSVMEFSANEDRAMRALCHAVQAAHPHGLAPDSFVHMFRAHSSSFASKYPSLLTISPDTDLLDMYRKFDVECGALSGADAVSSVLSLPRSRAFHDISRVRDLFDNSMARALPMINPVLLIVSHQVPMLSPADFKNMVPAFQDRAIGVRAFFAAGGTMEFTTAYKLLRHSTYLVVDRRWGTWPRNVNDVVSACRVVGRAGVRPLLERIGRDWFVGVDDGVANQIVACSGRNAGWVRCWLDPE